MRKMIKVFKYVTINSNTIIVVINKIYTNTHKYVLIIVTINKM